MHMIITRIVQGMKAEGYKLLGNYYSVIVLYSVLGARIFVLGILPSLCPLLRLVGLSSALSDVISGVHSSQLRKAL